MNTPQSQIAYHGGWARLNFAGSWFGPEFENLEEAQRFLEYVANKTGLDPYHQQPAALEHMYAEWAMAERRKAKR